MTRARRSSVLVTLVLGVLSMAPTPGDVGGCGRQASELDPVAYADTRKVTDCKRCRACGLATGRCARACDAASASEVELPSTCRPLQHDGEVCIRALNAASCSDYASYMDDAAPAIPSECDFCKVAPPADAPTLARDGGGGP